MIKKQSIEKRNPFFVIILSILFLIIIVPLLIPPIPISNSISVDELVDNDSQFIELNGYRLHYKEYGDGDTVLLLIHGLGPGLFTWKSIMQPLAEEYRVIAIDRPGFGISERPLNGELVSYNPYSTHAQAQLIIDFLDALDIQQVHIVGNSAGGTLAVYTSLQYPERFSSLILVDAAIFGGGGAPNFILPLLRTPQLRNIGPLLSRLFFRDPLNFLKSAWYNDVNISPEIINGYVQAYKIEDWDKAFWEISIAGKKMSLVERLPNIYQPVLVISGDSDNLVPLEDSKNLAVVIPNAQISVLKDCGHLPQEECPIELISAIEKFIEQLRP